MIDERPQDLFPSPFPLGSDAPWVHRRELFYQQALGPLEQPGIYHRGGSEEPHVDVYHFGRTATRDHELLITGGLADRVQPGARWDGPPPRRIEVLLRLPVAGPWAALILHEVATLPFLFGESLKEGSIIGGSRPVMPDTLLRNVVLGPSDEPALEGFLVEGEPVVFLLAWFTTEEEQEFAELRGGEALLKRLIGAGIGPVTDLRRPSVI